MGSDDWKVKAELNDNILEGFRDFMTRYLEPVTKLEELGDTGSRLLTGFQQVLVNRGPDLIESIVKANATERFKTYIEAGCVNSYYSRQCMSKSKTMINELEHLMEDLAGAIQTANGCLSPLRNAKFGGDMCQQQKEMSSDLEGVDTIDYASLMGIIYSMVKQDYVMQEWTLLHRISNSRLLMNWRVTA